MIRLGQFGTRVPVESSGGDEIAQLSRVFNQMAAGLEERERFRDTFAKYHSEEVAEKLLSGQVGIGGERKEALILFTDLRGFTSLSEASSPEQVVESLNEYLAMVVAIVRKNGGIIDKFIGDSVMATWGIPFLGPNDAHHAVTACLEIRAGLKSLNKSRLKRGAVELRIGMGLHLGTVVAGNIGSAERMEYTVIGDAVNTAARIESMTKELDTDFLISHSLKSKLEDKFSFESKSKILLRGKSEATEVFTVNQSATQLLSA
jgi:adenylate cyclase